MKAKRWAWLILPAGALLLIQLLYSSLLIPNTPNGYLKRQLGLDIGDCAVILDHDTHGGFHGDGSYLLIVDCTEHQDSLLEQTESWSPLPLPDELAHQTEQIPQFPQTLSQGRWYFIDRHSEADDPSDYTRLSGRYSYNYTLAVYDTQQQLLYYYELDT